MNPDNLYLLIKYFLVPILTKFIVIIIMNIDHINIKKSEFTCFDFEDVESRVEYDSSCLSDDEGEAKYSIEKAHKVLEMSYNVDADNINQFQQIVDRAKLHLDDAANRVFQTHQDLSISEYLAHDQRENLGKYIDMEKKKQDWEDYIVMTRCVGYTMIFRMD